MDRLAPVLDGFDARPVLLIGDALLDEYVICADTRICREAPVPRVGVRERRAVPGGAANVAANLNALGARVRFLSVVGDDPDGELLRAALHRCGVALDDVLSEPGRRTVAKRRVIAGEQLLLRLDEGAAAVPAEATRREVAERLTQAWAGAEVVVVSDYGYGLLGDVLIDRLGQLQASRPHTLVVDARQIGRYRHVGATAITPSYAEAATLLGGTERQDADPVDADGRGGDRAARVIAAAHRLPAALGTDLVVVTLDRDGALFCRKDQPPCRTWARPVPDSRACGAGDSFTSALALALAAGADTASAARVAQAAADVVTAREGTAVCSAADLRRQLAQPGPLLIGVGELLRQVAVDRSQGRRIVFTNGCFDLLHHGHIELLQRAKSLGDVLVVGLNSDESMRRLLGPGRPINSLPERAGVLAALGAVDHLVTFDETTAIDLVTRLRPEVYVKGGDYLPAMVPEAPHVRAYGGTVRILPYLEDRSTVALIERIRADYPLPATVGPRPGLDPDHPDRESHR